MQLNNKKEGFVMVDLDLNTLGYDEKFAAAPVFQKRGTVEATQLRERERE